MLEHGGRLREASRRFGIPLSQWVDLSTGVNPWGWPVPALAAEVWRRLPEEDDGLEKAAAEYYRSHRLLPLPGSQAAIQALPELLPRTRVACVAPLYREHPHAWTRRGHDVVEPPSLSQALESSASVVVVCNPNNPTASRAPRAALLEAAEMLARRGGWLVVDEAFADAQPEESLTALAGGPEAPNVIALRSLGKFFGLAGARVGFAFGAEAILEGLRERLGPWAVAGPAREVARKALVDTAWQGQARAWLAGASTRLERRLATLGPVRATRLFAALTLPQARAEALVEHLAARGLLVRGFQGLPLVRWGLPGSERDWGRLEAALTDWESTT